MATLYKVLGENGRACHGGSGKWHLPENGNPGVWMPPIKDIVPCDRGYHVLKPEMLIFWLGPQIFEVEIRGKEIWQQDKGVVEEARLMRQVTTWNEQTARLFACDCAETVIHLTKDERSKSSILVSRRYAFNLATKEQLDAAWYAARCAARYAARDAARYAASAAASAAASDAATYAARCAARCAARYAARDAARYAARDAARDAASAAASDAAWYAAWDAASAAAWDAASARLFQYLNNEVDLEQERKECEL